MSFPLRGADVVVRCVEETVKVISDRPRSRRAFILIITANRAGYWLIIGEAMFHLSSELVSFEPSARSREL